MRIENVENYLWMKKCHLNLNELKNSCIAMNNIILNNFGNFDAKYRFSYYNVLLYPFPQFHELLSNIKETFFSLNKTPEKNYYIQCWLNFHKKDEMIEWHKHWPEGKGVWHGYFCVDAEPSITSYELPSGNRYDVNNRNNHIIIGLSEGDRHRTWPWPYEDRTRITIAFDIVPQESIIDNKYLNHWIPI